MDKAMSKECRVDLPALIVKMAVDRDRSAFDCLYRACKPEIMARLLHRAGTAIDHSLLDDICQEAFETVWITSSSFDPAQHEPVAWIFEISRSIAIRTLHLQFQQVDVAADLQYSTPAPLSLEDSLACEINMAALRRAVDALSPRDAALLSDVYERALTHGQIAKKRAMPLGTVKATLRRITAELRTAIAKAGS